MCRTQAIGSANIFWSWKRYLALCSCHAFGIPASHGTAFSGGSVVKSLSVKQETWVWFPGQEDPLEKEMATHSSISCLGIPRREAWWVQSIGLQNNQTWFSNWTTAAICAMATRLPVNGVNDSTWEITAYFILEIGMTNMYDQSFCGMYIVWTFWLQHFSLLIHANLQLFIVLLSNTLVLQFIVLYAIILQQRTTKFKSSCLIKVINRNCISQDQCLLVLIIYNGDCSDHMEMRSDMENQVSSYHKKTMPKNKNWTHLEKNVSSSHALKQKFSFRSNNSFHFELHIFVAYIKIEAIVIEE